MSGQRGIPTIVGALALGLLAGPAAAAEGELMRDAMSKIGLIEPERPVINYNERAPLVMPPGLGSGKGTVKAAPKPGARKPDKGAREEAAADPEAGQGTLMSLPPPQTRQADPQWPKDPEIVRREREAKEVRRPVAAGAQGRMNDNNMTLSPAEMAAGRRSGPDTPGGHRGDREDTWLSPLQLLLGKKEAAAADADPVEPDRDTLTDPPTGYRKAPTRVVKQQGGPVGGSISGNEEADPRAYLREQNRR